MRFLMMKLLAATALSLTLAACVPGTTMPGATPAVVAPPVPKPGKNAEHYAGVTDDGIAVPTVPVEKVPEQFQVQEVQYTSTEAIGSIIISPAEKHLYFITGKNKALRYGIAVGREGFLWAGVATITNRTHWPKWTPPPEMIERHPELVKWEKGQPGGPTNPLGARALYLTTDGVDYGYRIHGTPEWFSIGKNASSGCIRMINQDVMDLYNRVQDGAKVVVLNADGTYPDKLKLPPKPVVKKKKAAPSVAKPVPAVPDLTTTPAAPATATTVPAVATTLPAATVPATPLPATPTVASAVTAPATPAVTPTPATVAPAVPATAVPAAATPTPAVTPAPAATVAPAIVQPAPTVTPASTCKVPLVNGVCPQS